MRTLLLVLAILALAFGAAILVSSEYAGEVVVLSTMDAEGREFDTSLWIVEDGGGLWLRAGSTDSAWYQRLEQRPTVKLRRGSETGRYRAVPVPHKTERIVALMAYNYGAADRLTGLLRDSEESMAIRLDPIPFSGTE